MAACYRHPSRETGVSCSSCGRPICPDCMTTTPVGMRCPECSKQRTRVVRMRTMARTPRVTYGLIAANVIVFLLERGQFGIGGAAVHGEVVEKGWVARYPIAHEHEYWRLVTNGFLHAGLLHIFFNMYLLYVLGLMLEPALGSVKFAAIYFTALLAGSFGALFATAAPSVGASGAVLGLAGAAAVELRARRMSIMESGVGFVIIVTVALSFTVRGVSVGAHIGGLIGGTLAALAIRAADDRHRPALGVAACVALSAVSVAGALLVAGSTGAGIA
ncbi:MAG: rhomboid family intramembrane serine protease [Solirubrobacteraceae bacterium]